MCFKKLGIVLPIILYMFFVHFNAFSQMAELRGKVVDENNTALPGANVYLQGTVLGSATNSNGDFSIQNVPMGNFTVIITVIGYEKENRDVSISERKVYDLGTILLIPSALAGEPIVVTAGKYEQNAQDVPASLSTVSSVELRNRNTVTLDDALKYVSGVNMASGQMNIRGASGYSMGVGSRVLFLLDGIPFLTGDTREINYETVPMYMVDHVEILKGAGSALYGSSALGGVVNIITRDIGQEPRYYFKSYGGMYGEPSYKQWEWSSKNRYFNGSSAALSKRFGSIGILAGGSWDQDDGYRENDWRRRWRGSGKLQWDLTPFQRLSFTGNYMHQKRGSFLYWRDLNHALLPGVGQENDRVESTRYYITSHYRNILGEKQYLSVRGIWYWNRFKDTVSNEGGEESTSKNVNGEIQYTSQIGKVLVNTGVEGHFNTAESGLFGNRMGVGGAAYMQGEIFLTPRWQATLGARFDYFEIDSMEAGSSANPKFGLVYKPWGGTAFRGSAGLGFRAPSMAEVFTSTIASGVRVIPNTDLKPERSIYAEIGWNQYLGEYFTTDVALFYSHFYDLIEGTFLTSGEIQFQNITEARVEGVESSLNARLFHNFLNLGVGYTYVDPWDLEKHDFLSFRPRHLFQSYLKLNYAMFQLGADYRFISRYDRIDEKFTLIVNNARERVPVHVLDMRLQTDLAFSGLPLRATFQVNNVLNYNYVVMVGSLARMRNFTLMLEAGI